MFDVFDGDLREYGKAGNITRSETVSRWEQLERYKQLRTKGNMQNRMAMAVLGILLALPLLLNTAQSSPTKAPATDEVRHFSFPSEYPIGALRLVGETPLKKETHGTGIGPASGSMTVRVPAGQSVLLDVNPHCLEQPARLKNIRTEGINRLKIAYLSMDDTDHSMCDVALQTLPQFKDLFALTVDRSDTTDKGLADFKSLPRVKYLSAFGAAIEGSILKSPQKLKQVESINFAFNPIKAENLTYLNGLPKLTLVMLDKTNIDDQGLKNLAKCVKLRQLYLSDNRKISDQSLPVLAQLTALEVLDLRRTSVTVPGMLTLKNLKLTHFILPVKNYRPEEIKSLAKAFPKAYIDYHSGGMTKDDQIMLAPMR